MSDPIVLLTDTQATPTPAGGYAATLATALNAQLLLLPLAVSEVPVSADLETTARALTRLAHKLPARAMMITPDEVVPEHAGTVLRRHHPQLLVLNRAADDDDAVETVRATATDLIFNAPYPVLVVPPDAVAAVPRRIAIAVDGGEFNVGSAATMVRQLLRSTDASFTVLHVIEHGEAPNGREALATVVEADLLPFGVQPVLQSWVNHVPADGILAAAAASGADLLLTIARRRSFWGTLLHTSVTADVIGRSPIPVLVVPTVAE